MRTGCVFLGVYLLVIGLIVLFIATLGGHMSGLLLVFPALPWPLIGRLVFGNDGLGIGMFVGLPLNAVLAFALGYWVARRRKRA